MEKHITELVVSDETQAATIFSSHNAYKVTIPKLKIGKLTLKDYPTVGLDLQSVTDTYVQLGHPANFGHYWG
jgi:hypothetical protein